MVSRKTTKSAAPVRQYVTIAQARHDAEAGLITTLLLEQLPAKEEGAMLGVRYVNGLVRWIRVARTTDVVSASGPEPRLFKTADAAMVAAARIMLADVGSLEAGCRWAFSLDPVDTAA